MRIKTAVIFGVCVPLLYGVITTAKQINEYNVEKKEMAEEVNEVNEICNDYFPSTFEEYAPEIAKYDLNGDGHVDYYDQDTNLDGVISSEENLSYSYDKQKEFLGKMRIYENKRSEYIQRLRKFNASQLGCIDPGSTPDGSGNIVEEEKNGNGKESPGVHWVNPYNRSDGTHVEGHLRSNPDGDPSNNLNAK